jgi:Fe-S-cluster containining protein
VDTEEAANASTSKRAIEGDELQLAHALRHVNEQINELAQQLFVAATELGALTTLLQEQGVIRHDELQTRRTAVGRRLRTLFQEKRIGVKLDTRIPDKYTIPPEALPQIDCEVRLPLCHAACCAMRFALSKQDLDEGVMRWEYGEPYVNRIGPDQRCVHQDRRSLGCTIYAHRPGVCRLYDCRKDTRIWLDFEQRVINPRLFVRREDGTLVPHFEGTQQMPHDDAPTADAE